MSIKNEITKLNKASNYISRDLSWLSFNERVLDQAKNENRSITERLKFLAITASNLDEFFMIRIGSLYNYIDYQKERVDYCGLREEPFRELLLTKIKEFQATQDSYYKNKLFRIFKGNGLQILPPKRLLAKEKEKVASYFKKTVYPMLTPMVFDIHHSFPIIMNKVLILGVVTRNKNIKSEKKKLSFIQIPQNLSRFYEIKRTNTIIFVPIEEIIREHIEELFKNVHLISVNLFRVTRNGDFTLEESEDVEDSFLEEVKRKLKKRKTGRVVRLELESVVDKWMVKKLKKRWEIDDYNIFSIKPRCLIDYTCLWQIVKHKDFKSLSPRSFSPVKPLSQVEGDEESIYNLLKKKDILLHHPYNTMEPVLELIEKAADDKNVLAIKITLYRVAEDSRITNALYKAAERGIHVSVLFEVKARFDEENNIREAERLQKAGCFVIYGMSSVKTHTKLLLIVRKEGNSITRYVHMASGNYNEDTSNLYSDLGFLSTDEAYANDVSEFFNVITGHSNPKKYKRLITAPNFMRGELVNLIQVEAENARQGLPSGIVIKMNSLQDDIIIDELYKASQAGVKVKLIVRGICCLKPGCAGISENIEVKSIVGDFLEHARIYYFHNNDNPKVYSGSADAMVRSFDRRVESLFSIEDQFLKKQVILTLVYDLYDNMNSYHLRNDGTYLKTVAKEGEEFSVHEQFYHVNREMVNSAYLF